MGDHRAGSSGSTATTSVPPQNPTAHHVAGRRIARHSAEQRPSEPYVGRRVARVAPAPAEPAPEVAPEPTPEAVPYVGRRVAGRTPVPPTTEAVSVRPVGRRIALDAELAGHAGDAEDVVAHLLRPTVAPTLEGYVGRRIARPVELITEPLVIKPVPTAQHVSTPPAEAGPIEAPLLDLSVLEVMPLDLTVLDQPVLDVAPVIELPAAFEAPIVEMPDVEETEAGEVEAAELVAPVLAAHPELRVQRSPRPSARVAPKRTRPGGRRASSRRTRVPSLPLLAGVAVLAISAGGALQAVHPNLTDDADGRMSPASALSGGSAGAGSASLLGRGASVSRDSDRSGSSSALLAAADADAKARDAALSVFASQAQKRANQIQLHEWVLPVQPGVYHLTARFGEYSYLWSSMHTGLDFAAPTGTPIMAVAGGTITEVGYSGAFGNRTIEKLPDGTELWYCHQNEFGTQVGATVKPGQVIGYIGSTGNVTGPHLHLEVHPNGGDPVDPFTVLEKHGLHP
jgi:murein DD-endopeptidase MepM/ murein hydrolase activator NlpD